MKIVINTCHGGFGLSEKAILRLAELGNKYAVKAVDEHNSAINKGQYSNLYYSCKEIPRHDSFLIKVVEELGEDANGDCSSLKIIDINVGYCIEEYDGNESIKYMDYNYILNL